MIPSIDRIRRGSEQVESWINDKATRAFAWLARKPVEDTGEFELSNGDTVDVYWFSKDSPVFGQATPVETILLNKPRFENLSHSGQELVICHEMGHTVRRPTLRGVFWGMVVIGAIGIYALAGAGLLLSLGTEPGAVAGLVSAGSLGTFGFLLTNRVEETAADLHAVRAIGEQDFRKAHREIEQVDDYEPSLFIKIWTAISYTRPENVIRLNRLLKRLKP